MDEQPAKNTDTELWRRDPGSYYSPSIFVTDKGGIGMNVGGHCIVMPVEVWHKLAASTLDVAQRLAPNQDNCRANPFEPEQEG